MLQIESLTAGYGSLVAVRDVHLCVAEGEIVSLLGPNGAGKTTLLSVISGQLAPITGRVTFDGTDITGCSPERIVRSGLALVPEGRRIFQSMTVEENLRLGSFARGSRKGNIDLGRVFDRFPVLRSRYTVPAGALSGGEQQQLAIGRALLSAPRLLMLDEPSLGLSPVLMDCLFEMISDLRREGVTVLLVEQNITRALEISDRAYLLAGGRVVSGGPAHDVSDLVNYEVAYLGSRED